MIFSTTTSATICFVINPATSACTGFVVSPPRRKPKKQKRKKKLPPKYGRVVEP